MNKLSNHPSRLVVMLMLIPLSHSLNADLTSLAKNDANPPYSTLNSPDDSWLLTKTLLEHEKSPDAQHKQDRFLFSISPFAQNANKGKSIKGQPCKTVFTEVCPNESSLPQGCPNIEPFPEQLSAIELNLGDITGRSGMLALLYGAIPEGHDGTYPGGVDGYLARAGRQLFPGQEPGTIDDDEFIDPEQLFGYFSFPLNYRKRGVRFELACRFYDDFLIRVQAGVCSIRQVVEGRLNLTNYQINPPTSDSISCTSVNNLLMSEVDNIAQEMNLDIGNLNQASVEEVRFNLGWRHAFNVNADEDEEWSDVIIIPYAQASASISPGPERKPNQLFAVPFGNNGHPSAGFTTGINFDFVNTIELGGEVGYTHFFKRSFCDYPVPNSREQTTIFPFQTDVTIQPGTNWHFGLRIASYHFLDNISMYFEWFVIDHKKDSITLKKPDPAFLPCYLEETTTFKTKMGNFALNWDASPNLGLGFLWQIPFSQRNTYRSSTIMAGINITF